MTLTPEQFNLLTTKEDLKKLEDRMTTVENKMATKEDLKKLEDKTDKITVELIATKEKFQDLYTRSELDDKFNQISTTLDAVMVKLDNIEHAFVSNLAAHDRFEERISRLENFVGINQPKVNLANNS